MNDNTATAADVRTWAKANGIEVGQRGRIASGVKDAFEKSTGRRAA
ncbi:histone-like nucleoid-structuring protein Lsr2 [Micromonospora sp. NPDC023956]